MYVYVTTSKTYIPSYYPLELAASATKYHIR